VIHMRPALVALCGFAWLVLPLALGVVAAGIEGWLFGTVGTIRAAANTATLFAPALVLALIEWRMERRDAAGGAR